MGNRPEMIVDPITIGVLNITESEIVTLLMFGSATVTVVEFATTEKFGVKFEENCCGVMFTNDPLVIMLREDVVPANRWVAAFRSCHA